MLALLEDTGLGGERKVEDDDSFVAAVALAAASSSLAGDVLPGTTGAVVAEGEGTTAIGINDPPYCDDDDLDGG